MLLELNLDNITFYYILLKICALYNNWRNDVILNERKRKISEILNTECDIEPEHGRVFVDRYLYSIIRYCSEEGIKMSIKYDDDVWTYKNVHQIAVINICSAYYTNTIYTIKIDLRKDIENAFEINGSYVNPLKVEFVKVD